MEVVDLVRTDGGYLEEGIAEVVSARNNGKIVPCTLPIMEFGKGLRQRWALVLEPDEYETFKVLFETLDYFIRKTGKDRANPFSQILDSAQSALFYFLMPVREKTKHTGPYLLEIKRLGDL